MSIPHTAQICFQLPEWLARQAAQFPSGADLDTRMGFVIATARRNIQAGSGGPFAAAVCERDTGRLIALGVNLVTAQGLSILHAEIVALSLAQRTLASYDLDRVDLPVCELLTSTEPCAMCLGAIPWSGVRRVVCGASDADARAIGFDEGHKPTDWQQGLQRRGIELVNGVQRAGACAVLREYRDSGGVIYNAGLGPPRA